MQAVEPRDGLEPAIPITVLTGFLGAGKTTLLNRILNGDHGLRVAVMVNDFGAINIDSELVVGMDDKVVSLANGCICCQINDDLIQAVTDLIESDQDPEYILIEASGVADPSAIALTFAEPRFRDRIRLDSVTSLVDAEQVFQNPKLQDLKLRQIAFSDMVVLNKIDLMEPSGLEAVRAWLSEHFFTLRVVEARYADVPLEILLSVGRFDPERQPPAEDRGGHHGRDAEPPLDHGVRFATWHYQTERSLSLKKLRRTVAALPGSIYRVKGIVHSADAPDQRVVLQAVGRRVDLAVQGGWKGKAPATRIVAIGAPGSIDAPLLQKKLEACHAGN